MMWHAACAMALRLIYLLFGTMVLILVGAWSTGFGHGPYGLFEALGSWFSVLLQIVLAIDAWLFEGRLWWAYSAEPRNADMILLFNVGIPVGFLTYYGTMKWCVRRCCSRNVRWLQLAVHMTGSLCATIGAALLRSGVGSVATNLVLGTVGTLIAGLFAGGDLLLESET